MQNPNPKSAIEFLEFLDPAISEQFTKETVPHPDLTNALLQHLYGNLYQRSQLSLRERLLVTIGALMFSGDLVPQLALQIRIALRHGISSEELMEVAFQISAFSGFGKAINAVNVVDSVADSVDHTTKENAADTT